MVTFADWALQASTFLNNIRPNVTDALRFRVFSCWIFDNEQAFELCQYGPYEVVDNVPVFEEPVCPVGMENYPYQPTATDQLSDPDQANLLFEEAASRSWVDLELNTTALGPYGEPVNGVAFLTSDLLQTCTQTDWPLCSPGAGLAYLSPFAGIDELGSAVVTNANSNDWHTLAHEVGHTLGLVHDDFPGGFMNSTAAAPGLGMSIDIDHPGLNNNETWNSAFGSKGTLPRSSGWTHTGCEGADECAPLGKPGWSCNGLWCVED